MCIMKVSNIVTIGINHRLCHLITDALVIYPAVKNIGGKKFWGEFC